MISRMIPLGATLVLLAVTGCGTMADHPIAPAPGNAVDPGPYVGTWQVTSFAGEAVDGSAVLELAAPTSGWLDFVLTQTTSSETDVLTGTVRLTEVVSTTLFSAGSGETGGWLLGRAALDASGSELTLTWPDPRELEQAVGAGLLSGRADYFDHDDLPVVRLDSSSADLRAYFVDNLQVFSDEALVVTLERTAGDGTPEALNAPPAAGLSAPVVAAGLSAVIVLGIVVVAGVKHVVTRQSPTSCNVAPTGDAVRASLSSKGN